MARQALRSAAIPRATRQAVPTLTLLDVLEPLLEEADDVLVVERVVDQTAVPARAHQPHVPEETQLVGHRRFGEVEASGESLDAQLGPRQRVQHAHARQIAKRA